MASIAELKILAEAQQSIKEFQKFQKSAETSFRELSKEVKKANSATSSIDSSLKFLVGTAAAVGTAFAGIFAGRKILAGFEAAISAARAQEDALNKLNVALATSGQFSKSTSDELLAFAGALQSTTTFSDDAILEAQALIQSLGQLDKEGLKGATQAALDLSAALGIDLKTASQLVGKAAAGEVGSFSRFGLVIEKSGTQAQVFENALAAINKQFGGAAAAQVNTFSGALAQMQNAFDDVLEEVGNLIIQNPVVISSIQELTKFFITLSGEIVKNKDTLVGLVTDGFLAVINTAPFVVDALEFIVTSFARVESATITLREFLVSISAAFAKFNEEVSSGKGAGGIPEASDSDPTQAILEKRIDTLEESEKAEREALAARKAAIDDAAQADFDALQKTRTEAEKSTEVRQQGIDKLRTLTKDLVADINANAQAKEEETKAFLKNVEQQTKAEGALEKATKKRFGELQKQIEDAAKSGGKVGEISFRLTGKADPFEGAAAAGKALTSGAEGAKSAVVGVLGRIPNVFTQAAAAIIEVFARPADEFRKQTSESLRAFAVTIPQQIATNIPVFIQELLRNIPEALSVVSVIFEALQTALLNIFNDPNFSTLISDAITASIIFPLQNSDAIVGFLNALVAQVPVFAEAFVEGFLDATIQVVEAFVNSFDVQTPIAINRFVLALSNATPFIAASLVAALVKEAPRFIDELVNQVKGAFGGGGAVGGAVEQVGGFFDKIFGAADGGEIPNLSKFQNDGAIIRAGAGENIVDDQTNNRLKNMLSAFEKGALGGGGGGARSQVIEIDGKQLSVILRDVNQRGFRTA